MPVEIINQKITDRLYGLNNINRLGHAYLFLGLSGCGKMETALDLALRINCDDQSLETACHQCPSCVKIIKNGHPDVNIIEVIEGQSIKIEQIRQMLEAVSLRPFFSTRKIFIIKDAEKMTVESCNALLKTLEEPTSTSLIILTSSSEEKLLPTIRSRCQAVHFRPFTRREVSDYIENLYEADKEAIQFVANYSEGSLGRAKELIEKDIFEFKTDVIQEFILSDGGDDFVKPVLADPVQTEQFLSILLSWVRDIILLKSGVKDQRLYHLDRIRDLQKFEQRFNFKELNQLFDDIINMSRQAAQNLNIKVPLMIIREQLWGK